MKIMHNSFSEKGPAPLLNQDCVVTREPVFAVIDGLGGHQAGEIAANTLGEFLGGWEDFPRTETEAIPWLTEHLKRMNTELIAKARASQQYRNMGATLAGVLLLEESCVVFHVGDARAYRYRGSERRLERLTVDDKQIMARICAGELSEEEAKQQPEWSRMTQAMGATARIEPHVRILEVARDDLLLLCTDGISTFVPDATMQGILARYRLPSMTLQSLKQAALDAETDDNLSAILIKVL